MNPERWARLLVLTAASLPLLIVGSRWFRRGADAPDTIDLHGRMADDAGWTPGDIVVSPGRPVRLRLVSDDVIHGFGIGRLNLPAIEMKPGQPVKIVITFLEPGTYVFYCTRWCGKNHWRMRGTIEVRATTGLRVQADDDTVVPPPVALGLDLDAPHPAAKLPDRLPSVARAESLHLRIPSSFNAVEHYHTHSPADAWRSLRAEPSLKSLPDDDVWDLVAWLWQSQATPASRQQGARLYAANCAACHGGRGRGDGVLAPVPAAGTEVAGQHGVKRPADFTDRRGMLGASPALLYGKIQRGGMGTGMPNWGPILTDEQAWALVHYLWTFQFPVGRAISPDPSGQGPRGGRRDGPE